MSTPEGNSGETCAIDSLTSRLIRFLTTARLSVAVGTTMAHRHVPKPCTDKEVHCKDP